MFVHEFLSCVAIYLLIPHLCTTVHSLQHARVVLQDRWSRTCEECRRNPSAGLNGFDPVRWASVINTEAHTCGGGDESLWTATLQPSFQASATELLELITYFHLFFNYGLLLWKAFSYQSYAWIIHAWIHFHNGSRSKLCFWLRFVSHSPIRFLASLWTAQLY